MSPHDNLFPSKAEWFDLLDQRKYMVFMAKYEDLTMREIDECLVIRENDRMQVLVSAKPPDELYERWFISDTVCGMRSFIDQLNIIKPNLEYECYLLTHETGIPHLIQFIIDDADRDDYPW